MLSEMTLAASDIERISDYAVNVTEYEEKIRNGSAAITDTGREELKELADAVLDSVKLSLQVFAEEDFSKLQEAEDLEQKVDDIQEKIINSHVERLMKVQCDPMGGVIFADLSNDLERCSDHGINIAWALYNDGKAA